MFYPPGPHCLPSSPNGDKFSGDEEVWFPGTLRLPGYLCIGDGCRLKSARVRVSKAAQSSAAKRIGEFGKVRRLIKCAGRAIAIRAMLLARLHRRTRRAARRPPLASRPARQDSNHPCPVAESVLPTLAAMHSAGMIFTIFSAPLQRSRCGRLHTHP